MTMELREYEKLYENLEPRTAFSIVKCLVKVAVMKCT